MMGLRSKKRTGFPARERAHKGKSVYLGPITTHQLRHFARITTQARKLSVALRSGDESLVNFYLGLLQRRFPQDSDQIIELAEQWAQEQPTPTESEELEKSQESLLPTPAALGDLLSVRVRSARPSTAHLNQTLAEAAGEDS